jgi:hypothetical protein
MFSVYLQVQDDLHQLKEKLLAAGLSDTDISSLEQAITKTEEGLQVSTCCFTLHSCIHNFPSQL